MKKKGAEELISLITSRTCVSWL